MTELLHDRKWTARIASIGGKLSKGARPVELLSQDRPPGRHPKVGRDDKEVVQVRKLLANRVAPPQDPAAALDPLPPNSAAREQVSSANLGQVHAFVEYALARDDL